MALLAVDCEDRHDSILVRAKGDIDSSTVGELVSKLTAALQLATIHPSRLIIIDLERVSFFGSAGLNAVLDCHAEGVEAGTSVRLVAVSAHVIRPIEVTNLDRVLQIYPTVTDALRPAPDVQA